jgi:hypothetical protein
MDFLKTKNPETPKALAVYANASGASPPPLKSAKAEFVVNKGNAPMPGKSGMGVLLLLRICFPSFGHRFCRKRGSVAKLNGAGCRDAHRL